MTVSPYQALTSPIPMGRQEPHYDWACQRQVTADQAPSQSKAEMQLLSELSGIPSDHLSDSLGLYEEYGPEVSAIAHALTCQFALTHFQR